MNKCGDCEHWNKLGVDSMQIGQGRRGECREGPPHVTTFIRPDGAVAGSACSYPNVPETFAACDRFSLRVVEEKTTE